jgi:pimeloyl-ACP methyl ester carboxylesterase
MTSTTTAARTARLNGIELAYQVFGRGDPLILLHGGFGSVEMFGPNVEALAAGRQVIGVDLQSHGRSPAADRPMRVETMADDIAALIRDLGFEQANVMGFSLGGAVALRTAIQHPDVVERLVLVSTVFKHYGWYPEMSAAMDSMGPEVTEPMKQSPMYELYRQIAPKVDDWPILVAQVTDLIRRDYDWSREIPGLRMPVMLVIGDADGLPPSHAVEFFGFLGGGKRDAGFDRSGMTPHRLAILPGVTHYDINTTPSLSQAVIPFLDGA